MRETRKKNKQKIRRLTNINPGQIKKINCYILIGPPAIGKSTFTNNLPKDSLIISRDTIVQNVASKFGLSYDDLFTFPPADSKLGVLVSGFERFGEVVKSPNQIKEWAPISFRFIVQINEIVAKDLKSMFSKAKSLKYQNVVIDMTNLDHTARGFIFNEIQNRAHVRYIGVVFDVSDPKIKGIIKTVNRIRQKHDLEKGIKKTITDSVFDRMFSQYSFPSYSEGFDKIIKVNTIENLKKFISTNS